MIWRAIGKSLAAGCAGASTLGEQLLDGRLFKGAGDRKIELPTQIFDGCTLDPLDMPAVGLRVGIEGVRPQKAMSIIRLRDVQTVPVDDRSAAQNEPNAVEIGEREVAESLERRVHPATV